MTGFFKLLCISFAIVTLCAVCLSVCFAWLTTNPKISQAARDLHSDHVFQCVHVAQWTLMAAGVSGMVWCALEFFSYLINN